MSPICDRIFIAGILFLILFTPFAFGTVQPWAYTAMEVIVFALVIVWMVKRTILARQHGAWSNGQGAETIRNSRSEIRNCAIPLTLFIALCCFQLVPLPPEVLRAISPQTFEVYKQSLPGWPGRVPYADLASMEQRAGSREQSAAGGQRSEDANQKSGGDQRSEIGNQKSESPTRHLTSDRRPLVPETWMPLSISAGLTKIDLLKFVAFAALFFLVWRYPFEDPFAGFEFRNSNFGFFVLSPEQRFLRSVVFAILVTGLLVAALGFIERFSWNGKILLFVAGYDWGQPMANGFPRASGPFINPDHFANYLSLIFPIALCCALFRTFMVPKSRQYGLKIFCGFTTFLLFTGILLSLSRGGWISALLGVVILAWLASWGAAGSREHGARSRTARGQRSEVGRQPEIRNERLGTGRSGNSKSEIRNWKSVVRLSAIAVCILLIVSLFFAGPGGREQVDARLSETIEQQGGLGARVSVILKDAPAMIRDFPLLGVGLGAWPELFLRYRSGPWSTDFFREAHNDYLEVLAETGIIGFGLLAVFFLVAGKRLVRGLRKSSSKNLPLIAGILAALGGMALHEWLDFSLQIPANAFLFTVLLALGLRLSRSREQRAGSVEQEAWSPEVRGQRSEITLEQGAWSTELSPQRSEVRGRRSAVPRGSLLHALSSMRVAAGRFAPYAGAATAVIMIAIAVSQDQSSYPYNFREMTSLADAKELLLKHPTHSPYHLSVLRLAGNSAPLEWQLSQAKAALWNEPVNPNYRDYYGATLMAMGKTEQGLQEIARSVAESPSLNTHVYLSAENLPFLSEEEQNAVEAGFKQALARPYPQALNGLAEFYANLDRHADQAALYEQAAQNESDKAKKTELLMNAGLAYSHAARATAREVRSQRSEVSEQGAGSTELGAEKIRNSKSEIRNGPRDYAGDAERLFRAAIAASPSDPKPYQQLVTVVYAAKKDLPAAKEVIYKAIENGAPPLPLYLSYAEAAHKCGSEEERDAALESANAEISELIKNGANPHTLYMTLAEGAQRAGDRDQEAAALLKALDLQPRSADTLARLANVYFHKQNFDRAALYLSRIAKINPDSADVHYHLAVTEEARYRFADASRAYARAVELAPKNDGYRQRYEAFRERVAANAPEREAR